MNLSHTASSEPVGYNLDADLLTETLETLAKYDDQERILEYLLRRILEYSGARRARIVIERSGELLIRAALDLDSLSNQNGDTAGIDQVHLYETGTHIQNCNELSAAVVNFAVHTGQPVLLEDAAGGRRFAHDPYIANHRPASLFCIPLFLFGERRGALYLENNTTRAVFSLERRSLLEMLAMQFLQVVQHFEAQAAIRQPANANAPATKNLREWVKPHFLFNTLNLIQPLIFENAPEASRSLNLLADGYRFLMELSGLELVPLESDWRFMEDYLKLMRLRFGEELEIKIKRPLSFREIQVPPLTLQPLVENALKHRRRNQRHRIEIIARTEADGATIIVRDNGRGVRTEDPFTRSLGKIRERLRDSFEDANLSLENRCDEIPGASVSVSFARPRRESSRTDEPGGNA